MQKKKKNYIGVSVELNQNRYNTKKLLGESIRTLEFLQEHFNVFEKTGEQYVEQNVYEQGKNRKKYGI